MSNGKIVEAELGALLAGVPDEERPRMKYLLTGIGELKDGLHEVKDEVSDMRKVCETRGLMCPGVHANLADPVEPIRHGLNAQATTNDASAVAWREAIGRKVWVVYGITIFVGATVGAVVLQDAVHALIKIIWS